MISAFYRQYSKRLLWFVVLTLPLLTYHAESIPNNNDIETWLPQESEVRATYDWFKQEFGAEELVLIGVSGLAPDDPLLDALAGRIERVAGIRQCWSPERLREVMASLEVDPAEIDRRLRDFVISEDGRLVGLVALLSEQGLSDRAGTVDEIRAQIAYCQLDANEVHLAGAPVVVAELDRLGSRKSNKKFFFITLLISLGLLYYAIRQWKPALWILGLTVWSIQLNLALVKLIGGEMNFIMGALSVMVMVFTLAVSVHFLHYYRTSLDDPDPLGRALRLAWKPCFLATLTTFIGLISLAVSNFRPVSQFGLAASIGSVTALLTGLGLTPAVLTLWPVGAADEDHRTERRLRRFAAWLLPRSRPVALFTGAAVILTGVGLFRLESKIDPLDFLPKHGKVLTDVKRIERDLTSSNSIEAVVDFGNTRLPFLKKLEEIRRIEAVLVQHPAVRYTMTAATFLPTRFPDDPFATAGLLGRAQARKDSSDFLADGDRLWRISARIEDGPRYSRQQILDELQAATAGLPITFTGIAPLLECAQVEIFNGFWESFAMAFVIITAVMVLSLRSLKAGLVAMIPNLTPICIVFGILGWIDFPVDIGMMMTGSIALGIAVDGTFHFLVRYDEQFRRTGDSAAGARFALLQTGTPIFEAAVIAAIGMLALTLSNFTPTARFGYMMATLLLTALLGDLVLLPALLSLRPKAPEPARAAGQPPPASDALGDGLEVHAATPERAPHIAPEHLPQRSRLSRTSNR